MKQSNSEPRKAQAVADQLRQSIIAGDYPAGGRLPAEVRLVDLFGVSRTVVREALATLRSDGLLESRRGSGVYVLEEVKRQAEFTSVDPESVSSTLEMLEFRTAVEVEAAGLAAQRRTPVQEEAIFEANEALRRLVTHGEPTNDADYGFHLAIAKSTGNPRFVAFLEVMGMNGVPRKAIRGAASEFLQDFNQVVTEHEAILTAIISGDPDAARTAMRKHLAWSQKRYRAFMLHLKKQNDAETITTEE